MKGLAFARGSLALVVGSCAPVSDAPQTAPVLQGGVDLTIGSADETRDVYMFGSVTGLALLDDGRILVADNSTQDVRVYGPDGVFRYTIGRAGAGPGELRRPCCVTIGPDGLLWIRDIGNRRFSLFALGDSQATFIRTIPSSVTSPRALPDRAQWDDRGSVVDIGQLPNDMLQRAFLDSTGKPVRWDSLKSPPNESLAVLRVQRRQEGGVATYYFYQPHGPDALRAHGPHGETADAVSSNYSVSWFDATGHRIALITRTLPGPELSSRERNEANSELDDVARQTGSSRSSLPFAVPARKPTLRSLGFDLEGRLWIERSVADGSPREADIYERDGRLVAVVRWPSHISLRNGAYRNRTAAGVAVDSLGTNTVVRLRFK